MIKANARCRGRWPGTCEGVVEQLSPPLCHYHAKKEAGLITDIPKVSRWYSGRSGNPVDILPARGKSSSSGVVTVDYGSGTRD